MWYKLLQAIKKEFLLLKRDIGGLITLFVMPIVLVITVTLIQDSAFQVVSETKIPVLVVDNDNNEISKAIHSQLQETGSLEIINQIDDQTVTEEMAKNAVFKGKYQFAIVIPKDLSKDLNKKVSQNVDQILGEFGLETDSTQTVIEDIPSKEIKLYFDPATQATFKNGIINAIDKMVAQIETKAIYSTFEDQMGSEISLNSNDKFISFKEIVPNLENDAVPNSVQHNVPAWTLFAIFFIIVPLSINLVKEKNQGTYVRLITNPTPNILLILGKTATYLIICLIQFYLILAVALYLFPQMGLPQINVDGKLINLSILTLFAGLAAIGLGILLGTIAKTQEQAAPFGSTFVVILAALGGVWIPVFAMPTVMQFISKISPMNWALNGYYDIMLRNGGIKDIFPEILSLFLFFSLMLAIALIYDKKKRFV
ncbi:ABC transporter permease [Paenimyroides tangerinum]|uniref:ABC transporter permease n=1 Tax=Paenimyroides tangerinum TaxID=2488728 RepID=A0A3P3W632_9FLAO|nr:ABC transporter permease [Paenimyroides tangerinum]RRJ90601.1 ABC transporter permease [Paenimyroides tangerinum]